MHSTGRTYWAVPDIVNSTRVCINMTCILLNIVIKLKIFNVLQYFEYDTVIIIYIVLITRFSR